MNEYPYYQAIGKVKKFFTETLRDARVPSVVDEKWLASVGYDNKTNDRKLIPILREIGFIDDVGVPTDSYTAFRDDDKRSETMRAALEKGYSELYGTYDNAHERSDIDLINFIKTRGNKTAEVAALATRTLKVLAVAGGLIPETATTYTVRTSTKKEPTKKKVQKADQSKKKDDKTSGTSDENLPNIPFSVAINVQFVLPETKDPDVFNAIFSEFRKLIQSQKKE